MDLYEAMEVLGIQRSIWIDDYFEEKKSDLFTLLSENKDIAQSLKFPGIPDSPSDFDPDAQLLANFIEGLDESKKKELEERFLEQQRKIQGAAVRELSNNAIQRTSKLLKVQDSDRITFKSATEIIPALCKDGDSAISYVVDLSDGNVDARAGLETLFHLSSNQSKGTIFILTHEATPENEASLEVNLRREYQNRHNADDPPPICVISKGRIDGADDDASLEEELKIALKRAGLRRGVHGVLGVARRAVFNAFEQASTQLLEIPPEQLDKFMVERAFNEGVSELHVVERALCASLAEQIRSLFVAESSISQQVKRLRTFRSINLKPSAADKPHDSLEGFRTLEIWEPDDIINSSLSPITCGDVFTLDEREFPKNDFTPRRFLLLGQQCDLQMRPAGRAQSYAHFVPLLEEKERGEQIRDHEIGKTKLLPFRLNSKRWRCDFRNATQIRLSILDLASFRQDGRVAFWQSQVDSELPAILLPGLEKIYSSITAPLKEVLAKPPNEGSLKDVRCQLTFSSDKPFSRISTATFKKAGKTTIRGEKIDHEARVTWCIRREGRIRVPYAASLLRDFLAVSGRDAFDVDFT